MEEGHELAKDETAEGGGVAILVRKDRPTANSFTKAGPGFEMAAIDDLTSNKRIIALYRAPRPHQCVEKLCEALQEAMGSGDLPPILVGDVNLDPEDRANGTMKPMERKLWDALQSGMEMQQHVDFVTRKPQGRQKGEPATLDHVWSREDAITCTPAARLEAGAIDGSDHTAIAIQVPGLRMVAPPPKRKELRIAWQDMDLQATIVYRIAKELEAIPEVKARAPHEKGAAEQEMKDAGCGREGKEGDEVYSDLERETAKQVIHAWEKALKEAMESAPRKWREVQEGPIEQAPWVTNSVQEARRKAEEARKLAQKPGADEEQVGQYKDRRRELRRVTRQARQSYIRERWERGDAKQQWQLLNKLSMRKPQVRPEPDASPDAVNAFFVDKIAKVRKKLEGSEPPRINMSQSEDKMTRFDRVTTEEVAAALATVKPSAAPGIDELPMSILKKCGPSLHPHLARLMNAVVIAGWPSTWKRADVCALWKRKGERTDVSKYRPVAILPAIGRLTERVLLRQILVHLERVGALPRSQHGYRKGHSVETAIAHIVDTAASARSQGETVMIASYDATAAFDGLSHTILLEKLAKQARIEGEALRLMNTFLADRKQRVRLSGGRVSEWLDLTSGTPQGAVWSPALWALTLADIAEHVTGEVVCLADDVNVVVSHRDPSRCKELMEAATQQLLEYFRANKILPSPEKTQLLLVPAGRSKTKEEEDIACQIGGEVIKPTPTITIMGATLDAQMNWEANATAAAHKAMVATRRVARVVHELGPDERCKIITALALPYLDANQCALAEPSKAAERTLEKAYNWTARVARWGMAALLPSARGITGMKKEAHKDPPPEVPTKEKMATLTRTELEQLCRDCEVVRGKARTKAALRALFTEETRKDILERRNASIERQIQEQMGDEEQEEKPTKFDPSIQLRSAVARKDLGWPTWEQRRAAARAAFASGVMERQQPKALAEVLEENRKDTQGVRTRKQELDRMLEPCWSHAGAIGMGYGARQAFRWWAPRAINAADKSHEEIFRGCTEGPPRPEQTRQNDGKEHKTAEKMEHDLREQRMERQQSEWEKELEEEFAWMEAHENADLQLVWTDGAHVNGGDTMGSVFYATGSARNRKVPVKAPGTAERAELAAIIDALEGDERGLSIGCDSKWTVDGLNRRMSRQRAKAWMHRPLKGEPVKDADLWRRAAAALDRRNREGLATEIRWVKAHATKEDVDEGRTNRRDAWGNHCAHALAQTGIRRGKQTRLQNRRSKRNREERNGDRKKFKNRPGTGTPAFGGERALID